MLETASHLRPRLEPPPVRNLSWPGWAIVFLSLLAPALGGSTQFWAQASLALVTGSLFLLAPPRRFLGWLPTSLFLAIGLLGLAAFLPASWFGVTPWREEFARLGIALPPFVSPQPWLTIQSACLLGLGLSWAYYVFAFPWPSSIREKAWDTYCFGVLALAATLIISLALHKRVPFWPEVERFGFFPNRNQTSNVLGLAGIMIYANAFQHLQRGRRGGWGWLAGLALICWALILNYSRSGIILFFGGTLAWHLWWLVAEREAGRTKLLAWGPLALLLALLLAAGGDTLVRFTSESSNLFSPKGDARLLIFRDSLHLFRESPVAGIGLGNFRSIFSSARHFYGGTSEAIHPESDWLWAAVEMGFLGPLLLFALFAWWMRSSLPFASGSWRRLRIAAVIAGCAFLVHGFFDVSGHRLGSLWPALFLAGTAIHPRADFLPSRIVPLVFRLFAVLLIATGIWWFASIQGARVWPTSATLHRSLQQLEEGSTREDFETALTTSSAALRLAPLNWELFFKRGVAEAALSRPRAETRRDFAAARYLLPNWVDLYLKEGQVWLAVGEPDLAVNLWQEGFRRLGPDGGQLYEGIYSLVKADPEMRERWRTLGHSNKAYRLMFLRNAAPTELSLELDEILSEDPQLQSFTATEQTTIFETWYHGGDKLSLLEALQGHPEWQKAGWRQMARAYADLQDYRQAYETVQRFFPPPVFPQIEPEQLPLLAARFQSTHNLGADGLLLAVAQFKTGALDDALRTIEIASTEAKAPLALHYLAAQIWAGKSDWPKAWQAIAKYGQIYN